MMKARDDLNSAENPFPQMNGIGYIQFLSRLHKKLKPNWYLEIGSERGGSLVLAKSNTIAVDPSFNFKHNVYAGKRELHLFQMTSDEFFVELKKQKFPNTMDLAFLDGLHLFEYLLRDFIGTERICKKDSVVVLHDCVPMTHLAADRIWDRSKTRQWTGDVWKLVPILREYRPDLALRVFDCPPSGMTVIQKLDSKNTILSEKYDEIIEKYQDLTIEDYGLDRLIRDLDIVHSESSAAKPFNMDP